ncbi:MAG TPA: hypothetical protein VIK52_01750 [Opitutaceae bacterium]
MDDPTGELRRQRELVAAHLRWLDEQIAHTRGAPSPPPPLPPAASVPLAQPPPSAAMASVPTPQVSPALDASAALPDIALPEIDPGSIRNEVRRGCFLYVIIASVLLAASVAVAVWIAGE